MPQRHLPTNLNKFDIASFFIAFDRGENAIFLGGCSLNGPLEMLCYAMLCFAMLCYAMLCYAMLCYAMLCYAMLCYAMLCYSMLCYAVLCFYFRKQFLN